jgi:hypothetical protein
VAKNHPTYEVIGLPPDPMILISDHAGSERHWQIMPVTVLRPDLAVKGKWTGHYESPEAALTAIDESFLQDPRHWMIDGEPDRR